MDGVDEVVKTDQLALHRCEPRLVLLSYAPLSAIGCRERDFARRRLRSMRTQAYPVARPAHWGGSSKDQVSYLRFGRCTRAGDPIAPGEPAAGHITREAMLCPLDFDMVTISKCGSSIAR